MACDNCSNNNDDNTTPCNGCIGCSQKCHEVVDTFPEADIFRNAFVTVREEGGAVYHIDDVGNIINVSRSPLYIDNFDPDDAEIVVPYKNVTIYDFATMKSYTYGPTGTYLVSSLYETNFDNVDNTADIDKPISTAVAAAIAALTGVVATKVTFNATAPASASATGTVGEVRFGASYIYVCTATNTWKRVAIATW